MKKTYLLASVVLLLMILAAGCASKNDDAATADEVATNDAVEEPTADSVDDANEEAVSPTTGAESPDREDLDPEDIIVTGTARELFPDAEIYPAFENMKVQLNGPDIVLEKLELIGKPTYEGSDDWGVRATLRYTGKDPAVIFSFLQIASSGDLAGDDEQGNMVTYENGDQISMETSAKGSGYGIDEKITDSMQLVSLAHKKVIPEISPEFVNLNKINVLRLCSFVDVTDVDLVQSDQNAEWKTVVIQLHQVAPEEYDVWHPRIFLIGADGEILRHEDEAALYNWTEFVKGSDTATIEISLGTIPVENIYAISVSP